MEKKRKVTIILFSGDMDKALAALNISIGAVSMGMEASIFFTFWGLNLLRKKKSMWRGKNFLQRLMTLLNRGGSEKLPLSKFNMLGMGPVFMKMLMKQKNMLSLEEALKLAREMGVKMIACTITMGVMGISREEMREDIVDSYAGVSTYLENAEESSITLFI